MLNMTEKEIKTIEILDSFTIIIINHYLKIVERFNKFIFWRKRGI